MSATLSPCPFCGAGGLGWVSADARYTGMPDPDGGLGVARPGENWWQVICRECGASGPKAKASRDNAVDAAAEVWNRRDDQGRLF